MRAVGIALWDIGAATGQACSPSHKDFAHGRPRSRARFLRTRPRFGADRLAELRGPCRADRADAPRAGRRAQMDRRGTVPQRAQFLPLAAWARSAAARHLYRMEAA